MNGQAGDETQEFLESVMEALALFHEAARRRLGDQLAIPLTVAYLDKLLPDAQANLPPDFAQFFERIGTSMTRMSAERE